MNTQVNDRTGKLCKILNGLTDMVHGDELDKLSLRVLKATEDSEVDHLVQVLRDRLRATLTELDEV